MGFLMTLIIGAVAGYIAKWIMPGDAHEPKGLLMTTLLGVVGAFVFTILGSALGLYGANSAVGLIGAVLGALITLFVWGLIAKRRAA